MSDRALQLVFAPLINCALLSWLHLTGSESSLETVLPFVAANVASILKANWMIWPVANFITFKFIPQDYRILFCNVLGVCWVRLCNAWLNASVRCNLPDRKLWTFTLAAKSAECTPREQMLSRSRTKPLRNLR